MTLIWKTSLLAILLLLVFGGDAVAKTKKMTLRTAMFKKFVRARAVATGTTGETAMQLSVTNLGDDTLSITTESGLLFESPDSVRQPLVLMGEDVIVLNACEERSVLIPAFCGNAPKYGPLKGMEYKYVRQLDTALVSILKYAKKSNISKALVQNLVWMFTNKHPLRSVYDPSQPQQSEEFIAYLSKKLKMEVPKYYINYQLNTSGRAPMVRQGEARILTSMSWRHDQGYRNVYVSVYRADGTKYKSVESDLVTDSKGTAVVVELATVRDPAGTYKVRLHDDANNILQEKVVTIGPELHWQ
ncbi:MAG: hypothetical protein JNM41_02890 [Flavipsychrobacter sp.]|nr:hypothetical protein [Flavipsychrobacter sp.]